MKNRQWAIVLLATIILAMIAQAVPNSLNVNGKLTSPSGSSLSGTYKMTFRLYKTATGGAPLWQKVNISVVTDTNGVYSAILKNITLNFSEPYYLGIMVQGDPEMAPRINLTGSPYAFRANSSEALVKQNAYGVRKLNITQNLTVAGNVGIGTTTPAYSLDVNGQTRYNETIVMEGTTRRGDFVRYSGGYKYTVGYWIYDPGIGAYPYFAALAVNNLMFVVGQGNSAIGNNQGGLLDFGNLQTDILTLASHHNNNIFLNPGAGNVGIGTNSPSKRLVVNGTTSAITFDPVATIPTINTTKSNITITSQGGSVIIKLG